MLPIVIAACCKLAAVEVDFYSVFWYLGIFVAMMACGIFVITSRIHGGQGGFTRVVTRLGKASFGIYLIHILVMRHVLWKWPLISAFGGVAQIIVTTILTLGLSWLIVELIALTPIGYYLVGYRTR